MELRDLPSVDRLVAGMSSDLPRSLVMDIARTALAEARSALLEGEERDATEIATSAIAALERSRPHGVINATGVLLHTNLGRAPLHPRAADVAAWTGTGYSNVELDMVTGGRGSRTSYLEGLLTTITGAEAAMVVNNNAAALFLVLAVLGADREVPVSRGELIEIGGSYRLPELMAASGCRLIEIGTTNRTRLSDYRNALTEQTALLLKVHPSNYQIAGFSEETSVADLVALGHDSDLPVVFDIGSGLIDSETPWISGPPPAWLSHEPGIKQSLSHGLDLALFSGDKLFAGPQAGIIVGRADLVSKLRSHPIARALRLDGPTANALAITAEFYADGRAEELPFWKMATTGADTLDARCQALAADLPDEVVVVNSMSTVGAGSVPGAEVESRALAIEGGSDRIFLELIGGRSPVVARRDRGRVLVDLRAIDPCLDGLLTRCISEALERCRS